MGRKMRLVWTVGVLAAMVLTSCGREEAEEKERTSREGSRTCGQCMPEGKGVRAAEFSLEDQEGKQVGLTDFAGKIVVMEWINPDCPFVQRHYEAKTMADLARKYKRKGVIWLAINSTHYMNQQTNKDWASKYRLQYSILDDHTGKVGRLYGAKTTPHMFIIDQGGKVVYRGAIDDDPSGSKDKPLNYVDQALGELVGGKAVSVSESKSYGCSVKYVK